MLLEVVLVLVAATEALEALEGLAEVAVEVLAVVIDVVEDPDGLVLVEEDEDVDGEDDAGDGEMEEEIEEAGLGEDFKELNISDTVVFMLAAGVAILPKASLDLSPNPIAVRTVILASLEATGEMRKT